jgi:predicted DCC family thiol-disulfide oxidoreductase YuxK
MIDTHKNLQITYNTKCAMCTNLIKQYEKTDQVKRAMKYAVDLLQHVSRWHPSIPQKG